MFAHSNAHRLLCSPLRTDVGAHSHRMRTECAPPLLTTILFCAHLCAFGAHAHHHYIRKVFGFFFENKLIIEPNFRDIYRQKSTTQIPKCNAWTINAAILSSTALLILNFKYSETSEDGHPLGNEKVAVLQRWPSYRGQFINDPYGKFTFEE